MGQADRWRGSVRDDQPSRRPVRCVSEKLSYTWAAYGSDRVLRLGAPLTIGDGEALGGIDLELQRAGVITGRVVDESGDPGGPANC
jgi:hypothetical protein